MYIIVDWFDLGYLGRLVDDENKCGLYLFFKKYVFKILIYKYCVFIMFIWVEWLFKIE